MHRAVRVLGVLGPLDWQTPDLNTSGVYEPTEPPKTINTPLTPEPSTKEDSGHDSNASHDQEELNPTELADSGLSSSIEPEQATEESNSADLDDQVTEDNIISSSDSEGHDKQTKTSGSEESEPEQAP